MYGKIDIHMNCIGIQIEQPILDVTEEAFDEVYEINLKASMFLAQAVARQQIEAGPGAIRFTCFLYVRSSVCEIVVTPPIARPKEVW